MKVLTFLGAWLRARRDEGGRVSVRMLGAVMAVAALGAAFVVSAGSSTDPTNGEAETLLTSLRTWIETHGVPLAIGLLFIGIVIGLLIKFGKRGAKAA
jgi:hypothetical protein